MREIILRTGVQTLRGDGDAAADDNTSAEEVFNVSGDNGLFHVHWWVCLCWRRSPLLHSPYTVISY